MECGKHDVHKQEVCYMAGDMTTPWLHSAVSVEAAVHNNMVHELSVDMVGKDLEK